MKKTIIYISIILISCVIFSNRILAEETTIDMSVWNYSLISETVDPFDTRVTKYKNKVTGKFGFCLEPLQDFYRSNKNYQKTNYSKDDQMSLYKLINAFDNVIKSNSETYSENDYYIATQLRIWELVTGIKSTINSKDYYAFGYKDIEEYINNNFKEIDINIEDIDDAEYGVDNYIYLDDINTENYDFICEGIELIDNTNHCFKYRITSLLPLEKTIKVLPIIDYKEYINDSLVMYNSIDSQDLISFEASFPMFLKGTSFKVKHKTGNLHLEKYDEYGNVVYDNIVFYLYDKTGNEILNPDGSNWIINDGVLDIDDFLPIGEYYLIESHNDKFVDNDEPIYFKIEWKKTTKLEVINEYANYDFRFKKIDLEGNDLLNTEFRLYEISDKGEPLLFVNTDKDINLYDALDLAAYHNPKIMLSERYCDYLNGFIFNTDIPGYFTYDIYDDDILIKQGKAYIVNNDSLSNNSYNYINASLLNTIYSDKENIIENLDIAKKYILCEYTPNIGYEYISDPCILIDKNFASKEYVFVNKERCFTLKLMKKDANKDIYLDGAKFLVTYKDEKGNIISKEYTTGKNNKESTIIKGGFIIKDIPYSDEVIIKEIEAPKGYYIDKDQYIINPDLDYSEITFENIREDSAIIIPPYIPVKTCVEL